MTAIATVAPQATESRRFSIVTVYCKATVASTLSDQQAADICAKLFPGNPNSCRARGLAEKFNEGKKLGCRQLAALHVYANIIGLKGKNLNKR